MTMRRRHALLVVAAGAVVVVVAACTSTSTAGRPSAGSSSVTLGSAPPAGSTTAAHSTPASSSDAGMPAGEFTMSFAGDVHFMDRVGVRLAANPDTVFGPAAAVLSQADLTMVNLETAITTGGGSAASKEFTFHAPPSAFQALKAAGIDIATMANNHGADYGSVGLQETLSAIASSHFPVVGIGKDAAAAYAPYLTTVRGTKIAILAASQVQDETLANYTAGTSKPGIASAYSSRLIDGVKAAKAAGYVVIVYVHWGIEYTSCPDSAQHDLATALAKAGAAAVIGTHVHEFQGDGWQSNGTFVAYGLGNYLWWKSFGNVQDDNGVLTLTFRDGKVIGQVLHPSHLNDQGEPIPATGSEATRIIDDFNHDRGCTGLSATPPS